MSYLQLAKQAEARLRATRETSPGYAIDAGNAVSATSRVNGVNRVGEACAEGPEPASPSAWPAALPGLGRRRVIPFTSCADCATDPPPDEVLNVGAYTIAVPGQRGTFAAYGAVALCHRHARARETRR